MKVKEKYKARAEILKALAHPTRLFIVDELSKGKKCVCKLTEMVGDDISTISKHLFILKSAGVVDTEKQGTNIYYSLKICCLEKFFECIDEVMMEKAKQHIKVIKGLRGTT